MNPELADIFNEGSGGGLNAFDLLLLIQSIGVTAVITYVAWICYSAYVDFGKEKLDGTELILLWGRSTFLLMLFLYIVIN